MFLLLFLFKRVLGLGLSKSNVGRFLWFMQIQLENLFVLSAFLVSFAAVFWMSRNAPPKTGERCVTSQKRLRRRLAPSRCGNSFLTLLQIWNCSVYNFKLSSRRKVYKDKENCLLLNRTYYTVPCLVFRPLNRREARFDFVITQTWLLFKGKLFSIMLNSFYSRNILTMVNRNLALMPRFSHCTEL